MSKNVVNIFIYDVQFQASFGAFYKWHKIKNKTVETVKTWIIRNRPITVKLSFWNGRT